MMDGTVSGRFAEVVRGIARAGRKPVLLASDRAALSPYGNGAKQVMLLHTDQEEATKMHRPESINPLDFGVWMLEPAP